jgi:hypothetical protein
MKTIFIGICDDNIDPLGLGRIRFKNFSVNPGNIEGAFEYKNWDTNDPFVASPLLPGSFNHVPEINQAVKIFLYDTDKQLVNKEYIAGPFNTSHDFNNQTFSDGVSETTFGNSSKKGPDIFLPDGSYVDKKAKGAIAKPEDYAISGMYGSDVLFTDSGVNIRAGKFPTKEFANATDRKKLISQPLMSDNTASLTLKKFPRKLELVEEEEKTKKFKTGKLKYMVEYEIEDFSFTGTTRINFDIYNTLNDNDLFNIQNVKIDDAKITTGSTLMHVFSDFNEFPNETGHTFTVTVSGVTEAYITVRNIIKGFNRLGFKHFNSLDLEENVHPFYFRPKKISAVSTLTGTSQTNRELIFGKIDPFNRFTKGMVFSKEDANIPFDDEVKKLKKLKETEEKQEQSFASMKGDQVYLISTDTNELKPINFKKIDKYEPTHSNFVEDIRPNTYAMVRGEILLDVLTTIVDLLESHQHQPTEPMVKSDPNFIRLQQQISTLQNDLLNESIRIN